jgi:arylsulfatase A-like enzyme
MNKQLVQAMDKNHLNHCKSLLGVDDAVGTIIQALQSAGRLDNTLIVFASDNGIEFGEHRWPNKKVAYEESTRIPIIVRDDAIPGSAGRVDKHLVLNLDFAPTFAAAGGATAPGAEGTSFLPLLDGSETSWRSDFLVEHWQPQNGKLRGYVPPYCGLRTEDAMYVEYQDHERELYLLNSDPYELNNQASNPTYASQVAQLQNRMAQLCSPPPPDFVP